MKKRLLLKALGITLASVLSATCAQTAYAQGPARLDYSVLIGNQAGSGSQFLIKAAADNVVGPYLHLFPNDNGSGEFQGSINSIAGYNGSPLGIAHSFQTRETANGGRYIRLMQILQNGKVRIGEQLPDQTLHSDYKLAVAGKIVGQSLFITRPSTWSDYVFAPTYHLLPLPEVAAYIDRNQHLPDVPAPTRYYATATT